MPSTYQKSQPRCAVCGEYIDEFITIHNQFSLFVPGIDEWVLIDSPVCHQHNRLRHFAFFKYFNEPENLINIDKNLYDVVFAPPALMQINLQQPLMNSPANPWVTKVIRSV